MYTTSMMITFMRMAIIAQVALSFTIHYSYTVFNIVLHLCTLLLHDYTNHLPTLFTNTLALQTTFYVFGFLIEPTFFVNMRKRHGCSTTLFVFGDAILHTFPSILHIVGLYRYPNTYRQAINQNPSFGLQSMFLQIAWCVIVNRANQNPFILDTVYVHSTPCRWVAGLHVVIFSHMLYSLVLVAALYLK